MNGKILNRIPLIRRLKWREYIGCNVLWGNALQQEQSLLTKNQYDPRLLHFPGRFDAEGNFTPLSHVMDKKNPYVEVIVGIHNIFKIFHIEYVHRLNYITPDTQRWGIRGMFRMTF